MIVSAPGRVVLPPAPTARGRPLTDRGAVLVAITVALGAWAHRGVPLVPAAASVAVALAWRRPAVLVLAAGLLASALGARAVAGLGPVAAGPYAGPVTLVADPEPMAFGARVDVRVGGRHLELWAAGGAAGALDRALAGERVWVEGRMRPPPPRSPWLVPRHVVGRLDVSRAEAIDGGAAPWRAANRFRRLLAHGAEAIPDPARSLYSGFVLGDGRGQPPEIVDDFRGAGLTHLLVVSGENVAFVLTLASPLTRRPRLSSRWVVTVGVIVAFGVVTRFEPSVLRACAMATLAASASWSGRPASTVRLLALATAGLLLIDPLLVDSVGFQLSVAASAGIAIGAHRIARHLPGPAALAEALGVTLAAQLGVAPVLLPRFGGLPVVSVAANLVAVPVAGLVTTWGLPAGVVAGLAGGRVAALVHLPTRVFVWWVAGVARWSAWLPLGELHARGVLLLAASAGLVAWSAVHRPAWRALRAGAAIVAVGCVLAPGLALRNPPAHVAVAEGADLYRAGGATVLVLEGRLRTADVLEGLRLAGTRRLDLVVAGGPLPTEVERALRHRWPLGRTLATADGATSGSVGNLEVVVDANGEVAVRAGPA